MAHGVEQDFANIEKQLDKAIAKASKDMGEWLTNDLTLVINEEVYAKYKPKVYKRRSEDSSLGTPLDDMNGNAHITTALNGARLIYAPTGEHANTSWHTRDADDLIHWFDEPHGKIPARPFWEEFLKDVEEKGEIEFVRLINLADPNLDIKAETIDVF